MRVGFNRISKPELRDSNAKVFESMPKFFLSEQDNTKTDAYASYSYAYAKKYANKLHKYNNWTIRRRRLTSSL